MIELKANQWWKIKEGKGTQVIVFYVRKVVKETDSTYIDCWANNGKKKTRLIINIPTDLDNFELCSKHEALAILL